MSPKKFPAMLDEADEAIRRRHASGSRLLTIERSVRDFLLSKRARVQPPRRSLHRSMSRVIVRASRMTRLNYRTNITNIHHCECELVHPPTDYPTQRDDFRRHRGQRDRARVCVAKSWGGNICKIGAGLVESPAGAAVSRSLWFIRYGFTLS